MFLFFCFYEDKVMGRHAWNKVDINGDRWKTEDSANVFHIYSNHYRQFSRQEE